MAGYNPRDEGCLCDKCPLRGQRVVPPEVNRNSTILIVGEAPGPEDEKYGRPFLGDSGQELDRALSSAGIRRGQVTLTNAVLCRPPNNDLARAMQNVIKGKGALDAMKHALDEDPVRCCAPRLEAELSGFKSVIAVGKTAVKSILQTSNSILAIRGGLHELADGTKVLPTVHPSFVRHQPRWTHVFRSDIAKAARFFRGESGWTHPKITLQPTIEHVREFLRREDILAFDLETDGIENLTAKIRCVGISTSDEAIVIIVMSKDPYAAKPSSALGSEWVPEFYTPHELDEVMNELKAWFVDPNRQKCSHNGGSYDFNVLRSQWGIEVEGNVDTILLHRSVESELPHSLAFVGALYTDAPPWKCYDGVTEVLTPSGWTRFDELQEGVPVAQWGDGTVNFVQPVAYVNQAYAGKMWHLEDQATDLLVSPDHTMVYRPVASSVCKVAPVQDLPTTGTIPHTGVFQGSDPFSDSWFIKLLVAFQADGSWAWRNEKIGEPAYLDFGFTKERKIQRIKEILDALHMPYTQKLTGAVNPRTRIWVDAHPNVLRLWALLGPYKHFGAGLLQWPLGARLTFLDELSLWDGTRFGREDYNSVESVNADIVQACAVVSGRTARKFTEENKNGIQPIHKVRLLKSVHRTREWSHLRTLRRRMVDYDGRLYCVSVPSGFLLVRRNGKVTVSGNTGRDDQKLATGAETDEELARYCALDCTVTRRVLPRLIDTVVLRGQMPVFQLDTKIQRVCSDMHAAGMYVDQTQRLMEEKRLLELRFRTLKTLRELLENDKFNPGSVFQLRDLLFNKWQLDPPLEEEEKNTKSGDPSTGDLVLRALLTQQSVPEKQREIIKVIRRFRKVQKLIGTYVTKLRFTDVKIEKDLCWDPEEQGDDGDGDTWLDDKDTKDRYGIDRLGITNPLTGRMYPGYNAHVAVTGRLSSSRPMNAQNFPKSLRRMVTAAPGNVLIGADMDQLELRIIAAIYNVDIYLRAFQQNKDPHSMTAFAVFGQDFCKAAGIESYYFHEDGKLVGASYDEHGKFTGDGEAKKMRDMSKNIQYASQYMAAVETVYKLITKTEVPNKDGTTELPYALMPLRKVRDMREAWLKGAPEFESGWQNEIQMWRDQGYLMEDVTFRRRDFLDGENPNELVNYRVQASAAGLMNIAILELAKEIPLHKWGPGTGIINQCHDAIVIECPADGATSYVDEKGKTKWNVPKGSIPARVVEMLEEHMNIEHPALPGVKFTATADIGHSWDKV